jgi:mRNA-degrading endonuclease RelE of RelBE toxin-antitoxin system
MSSSTTRRFRELLAELPAHVRQQASQAYRLFVQNPAHPGLRFKKVHPDPPIYSARVGIGYRAVCTVEGDKAIWFWIGTHAEYDELLKRL